MDKIISLLDHVSEIEQTLATGGLVKDDKGNWLKSGERVRYKNRHKWNNEWNTGEIRFDLSYLQWYLCDDKGDILYLGKSCEEVEEFEKIED